MNTHPWQLLLERLQLNLEALSQKSKQHWDLVAILPEPSDLETAPFQNALSEPFFEALSHTFVHSISNSVSHGYMRAAERESRGWDARTSFLFQVSLDPVTPGIQILIGDDGPGPDWQKVRKKAHDLGVDLATISGAKKWDVFFMPQFSTMLSPNELSGRGIGLDAVREEWKKLGAAVTAENHPGEPGDVDRHGFVLKIFFPI
ncbi:MAG: hypothetical protein JNL01_13290 [Bdellovibrionales bacterium]|nr:hypothetical protein [Bdellovibrionales bacterium]